MMDIDFSQALVTNYFFFRFKKQAAAELTKRRENSQLNRQSQPVNQFGNGHLAETPRSIFS